MIVVFSGWRDWGDASFIHQQIEQLLGRDALFGAIGAGVHVRVGEQRGADTIVRQFVAGLDGVSFTVYDAGWCDENRKYAGSVRNRKMLVGDDALDPTGGRLADLLVAFPQPGKVYGGRGSGTWNCICQAQYRGVEVRIPAYKALLPVEGQDLLTDLAAGVAR